MGLAAVDRSRFAGDGVDDADPCASRADSRLSRKLSTVKSELLAILADPQLLKDAVAITGNGDLAMLRGRSDPIGWIKKRLEVTTARQRRRFRQTHRAGVFQEGRH